MFGAKKRSSTYLDDFGEAFPRSVVNRSLSAADGFVGVSPVLQQDCDDRLKAEGRREHDGCYQAQLPGLIHIRFSLTGQQFHRLGVSVSGEFVGLSLFFY